MAFIVRSVRLVEGTERLGRQRRRRVPRLHRVRRALLLLVLQFGLYLGSWHESMVSCFISFRLTVSILAHFGPDERNSCVFLRGEIMNELESFARAMLTCWKWTSLPQDCCSPTHQGSLWLCAADCSSCAAGCSSWKQQDFSSELWEPLSGPEDFDSKLGFCLLVLAEWEF